MIIKQNLHTKGFALAWFKNRGLWHLGNGLFCICPTLIYSRDFPLMFSFSKAEINLETEKIKWASSFYLVIIHFNLVK